MTSRQSADAGEYSSPRRGYYIDTMYQVLFPEGQLECARYDQTDTGVQLYDEADDFIAFGPYENLHAVIDEEQATEDSSEPSVM